MVAWVAGTDRRSKKTQDDPVYMMRRHGMGVADAQMWFTAARKAKCAIPSCETLGTPEKPLQVDHDHDHDCCGPTRSCAKCRRGLFCFGCNRALGSVGDSVDKLRDLVTYVRVEGLQRVRQYHPSVEVPWSEMRDVPSGTPEGSQGR